MTRAGQITRTAHTAGQVRREAQRWCASMTRHHRTNNDTYRFTDGSSITVTGNAVRIQGGA